MFEVEVTFSSLPKSKKNSMAQITTIEEDIRPKFFMKILILYLCMFCQNSNIFESLLYIEKIYFSVGLKMITKYNFEDFFKMIAYYFKNPNSRHI